MAVSVTNTELKRKTDTAYTANAATATGANGTEVFTFTLPRGVPAQNCVIGFYNGLNVTGTGAMTYSFAVGGLINAAATASTGSVAQNAVEFYRPSGDLVSASGTLVCTLTPASGKALLTDHAAGAFLFYLP